VDAGGRVTALAHDTKACVLTQASASILGERLKGARREDVEALANAVAAMLVNNAEAPSPPFEPYAAFQGAVTHRNRHRCVLLPIEAVLDAFEQEPNHAA
jgi:NifU-like protein involved in Fe-S cluster formation